MWRINIDGTGLQRLTRNRVNDTAPTWGTSNRIAFERKGQILTMGQFGKHVRRVTSAGQSSWNPNWSPNGRWLAFNRGKYEDGGYILKLRLNDGRVRRLTKAGPWGTSDPAWSPNGRKIVYRRGDSDLSSLVIMRANGMKLKVLHPDTGIISDESDYMPDWQPLPDTTR